MSDNAARRTPHAAPDASANHLIHDIVAPAGATRHILVLHGLGDSRNGWKSVVPYLDLPEVGWIFAQAPEPYYDGWSWFDLALPDTRPDAQGVARSRALLIDLLASLERDHGIPAERLTVMGFSQGCLMALELALTHDRVFAGIIGISGWIYGIERFPGAFAPAALRQRILMTHGHDDPVIPITRTRPLVATLRGLGVAIDWREYDKAHGVDPQDELPDLRDFLCAAP